VSTDRPNNCYAKVDQCEATLTDKPDCTCIVYKGSVGIRAAWFIRVVFQWTRADCRLSYKLFFCDTEYRVIETAKTTNSSQVSNNYMISQETFKYKYRSSNTTLFPPKNDSFGLR